jgi:hypothetical protein
MLTRYMCPPGVRVAKDGHFVCVLVAQVVPPLTAIVVQSQAFADAFLMDYIGRLQVVQIDC